MSEDFARYAKQVRFAPIGEDGQRRLRNASVGVVGCGALGALVAEQLCRAGVGTLRLIDRDFVERSNLQRQVLYTERDAAERLPKAAAAASHLAAVNGEVVIEPHVSDLTADNAEALLRGLDLVVDGTDNLETRYLLNEVCMDLAVPWVYGGCLGAAGQAMLVAPPRTPCLRCLFPEPPPTDAAETCDSAGVIGPAAHAVASFQSAIALQTLACGAEAVPNRLAVVDLWDLTLRSVTLPAGGDCETCRGERPYRSGAATRDSAVLCGRNAVQLTPPAGGAVSLDTLANRFRGGGTVEANRFLLRWEPAGEAVTFTVFRDGRTVVHGTDDPAVARSAYSRLIGN